MSNESADEDKQRGATPPPPAPFPSRGEPNLPPHLREQLEKTSHSGVDKTKIDYEAVTEVVIQTVSRKEIEVAEMMATNPDPSQVKPFIHIDNFEPSSPCSANASKKDRVGFCEKCKLRYYDFSGMELPQAEELIFKMEGIEKPQLFKRSDGKFMTRDCPVGRRKRMNKMIAIGSGFFVILFAVILYMINPRPVVPVPSASAPKESDEKTSEAKEGNPQEPKEGSHHRVYRNGHFIDVE